MGLASRGAVQSAIADAVLQLALENSETEVSHMCVFCSGHLKYVILSASRFGAIKRSHEVLI